MKHAEVSYLLGWHVLAVAVLSTPFDPFDQQLGWAFAGNGCLRDRD